MPVMVAHVMRHCSLPLLLPQAVEPDDRPAERNVPGFPLGHNHRLGCVGVWQDRHSELGFCINGCVCKVGQVPRESYPT